MAKQDTRLETLRMFLSERGGWHLELYGDEEELDVNMSRNVDGVTRGPDV